MFGCITEKPFAIQHLVAENTSETLKIQKVLNVDNCLKKENRICVKQSSLI